MYTMKKRFWAKAVFRSRNFTIMYLPTYLFILRLVIYFSITIIQYYDRYVELYIAKNIFYIFNYYTFISNIFFKAIPMYLPLNVVQSTR